MSDDVALPLEFTEAAANKVKHLIADEDNPNLKLRVYITGGGCSGFQYGFTFDDQVNEGDMTIEKQGVGLVVDPMSLQYLVGGSVDYTEGLEGSRWRSARCWARRSAWRLFRCFRPTISMPAPSLSPAWARCSPPRCARR